MMSLFHKRCLHELQTSTSLSVQLSFYSSGTGVHVACSNANVVNER